MNAAAELLEPARATRIAPAGAGEPLYMLRYRIYMPHGGTCEFAGAVSATFPQILALRCRQIDRMLRHGLPPLDCWIVPAPAGSEASPL